MFQRLHRGYISKVDIIFKQTMVENDFFTKAFFYNAHLWREECKENRIYKKIVKN